MPLKLLRDGYMVHCAGIVGRLIAQLDDCRMLRAPFCGELLHVAYRKPVVSILIHNTLFRSNVVPGNEKSALLADS